MGDVEGRLTLAWREMTTLRRRALLVATLGFALVPFPEPRPPVIDALHRWLDTWTGLALIGAGMARQGYDLQLPRYAEAGWRATFYVSGMEHSPTRATGTAWERTPFAAVQRAAWEALRRGDEHLAS